MERGSAEPLGDSRPVRAARRLSALLAARTRPGSARRRRVTLGIALALFLGGTIVGALSLPEVDAEPRWELLAVVGLVGIPLMLALNAAEYQLTGSILGYRIPFVPALRISVLASAANLLPIPGALLVRAYAIRGLGASLGQVAMSTGAVGTCFVGTAAGMAAATLVAVGELALGGVMAAAGLVLLVLTLLLVMRERGLRSGVVLTGILVAVEVGSIAVKAGRFYLVFQALGYSAGVTQALALTLAAVLATMLGFFPGGLGAAELLAAATSPLVGVSAAVGLVTTAVDRLLSMAVLGIVVGAAFVVAERRRAPVASDGELSPPPDA